MLDDYLKKISEIDLLEPEEEVRLWQLYKEKGVMAARQKLISSYQPLVFKLVRRYCDDNGITMDLIQEGNIGLIDAVDAFDPAREVQFSTFAYYHIRGRILDYLHEKTEQQNISLKREIDYIQDVLEKKVEQNFLLEKIERFIRELPSKEQEIIKRLYLGDEKAEIIATDLDISLSYLYRLQKKALRRLRGKLSRFMQYWK